MLPNDPAGELPLYYIITGFFSGYQVKSLTREDALPQNHKKTKTMKTDFDTAKTASLAGLVDYSKEAIVSKTLIKKETGTVTLFAFDKGQGLSEHTTPFNAMVQVVDGEALVIIDKKKYKVSAGEFIIMPADVPHALDAEERFKMLLTMIKSN